MRNCEVLSYRGIAMRWLVAFLAMVGTAAAQDQITVATGGSSLIRLTKVPATVIVPNESVARVELGGSPQTLMVYGRTPGLTTITAQDDKGAVFYTAIVTVGAPDRVITIISKPEDKANKQKGVETTDRSLKLHDQYSYRCNQFRCQQFTPRNRPLDEDQVPPQAAPQ